MRRIQPSRVWEEDTTRRIQPSRVWEICHNEAHTALSGMGGLLQGGAYSPPGYGVWWEGGVYAGWEGGVYAGWEGGVYAGWWYPSHTTRVPTVYVQPFSRYHSPCSRIHLAPAAALGVITAPIGVPVKGHQAQIRRIPWVGGEATPLVPKSVSLPMSSVRGTSLYS